MPDTAITTNPAAMTLTIVALLIAVGVLALLILVLAGIHDEERHMSLTSAPRTRIGAITRHLTGAGARTPGAAPGKRPGPRFPFRKRSDMTVAIPPVTLPGAGTGRNITGPRPASGLLLIMSGPAAPAPGSGSQPAPPRWPGDRSGSWLRHAAAGLCVLAAAAAAVSFTAQYRMVETARHLPVVAALEAAIPDAAALVFACLGIALALHGRRALRARALNLASVAASVFMNAIGAAPGWRNLAIWAMAPRGVRPGQRHPHHGRPDPPPATGRRRAHPAGRPRRPDLVAAASPPGAWPSAWPPGRKRRSSPRASSVSSTPEPSAPR
jgi:hypothetical protein